MAPEQTAMGLATVIEGPMSNVESAVRQVLVEEGFGVLTEIDVAAILQAKLGVQRAPLRILGACNPSFAHRALALDPSLALVLPCNVVLEDVGEGRVRVAIADPRTMIGDAGSARPELVTLGDEAAIALEAAITKLGG